MLLFRQELAQELAASPGLYAVSSDRGRLKAEHGRQIFPLSCSGDVTFDFAPRITGNEAVQNPLLGESTAVKRLRQFFLKFNL